MHQQWGMHLWELRPHRKVWDGHVRVFELRSVFERWVLLLGGLRQPHTNLPRLCPRGHCLFDGRLLLHRPLQPRRNLYGAPMQLNRGDSIDEVLLLAS